METDVSNLISLNSTYYRLLRGKKGNERRLVKRLMSDGYVWWLSRQQCLDKTVISVNERRESKTNGRRVFHSNCRTGVRVKNHRNLLKMICLEGENTNKRNVSFIWYSRIRPICSFIIYKPRSRDERQRKTRNASQEIVRDTTARQLYACMYFVCISSFRIFRRPIYSNRL